MIEVANIPVIEIMDSTQPGIQQVIGFDNVAAAQTMVETMITRGYKILCISLHEWTNEPN
ncbi:transcriptional regulator GntR [Rodentibacter pneumotropicus]|uniref:Transcriptional regulator GntR n=1 Tax=Rodentibacter pneumotropicus TaxID=758 RepID=A0A3S4U8P7_9PAST|nr:transcriptional regulator GntR [Rodentibacter pneumotropicus]